MSKNSGKIYFCTTLFLIFLILKLTDNIDWSWWKVTSPLWVPWTVIVMFVGVAVFLDRFF